MKISKKTVKILILDQILYEQILSRAEMFARKKIAKILHFASINFREWVRKAFFASITFATYIFYKKFFGRK